MLKFLLQKVGSKDLKQIDTCGENAFFDKFKQVSK